MRLLRQIFLGLLVLSFLNGCGTIVYHDQFDSAKWKQGDKRTRGKMIYDLRNSKILIGKTESEVLDLLGKDDDPKANSKTYVIDANIPTNVFFSIHFDNDTRRVKATDIDIL
jgi:hypothetical protein